MFATRLSIAAAVLLGLAQLAPAQWKPAKGPLTTQWTAKVSPDNAHPEYPRMQMVRKRWLNLNGLWQYAPAEEGQDPPVGKDLAGKILVPYPVESALSGVAKRIKRLWYRRTFDVPQGWLADKGRVLLHFQAVDWEATVYVNGKKLGMHRGGYDAFTFDATAALKAGAANELIVGVFDPTSDGAQARGKQVNNPRGIWYTPTTGIWQTVWIEPVAEAHIRAMRIVPDIDKSELRITVDASKAGERTAFQAVSGERTASAASDPHQLILKVPDAKLWSPDSPHLYDLKVTMTQGGKVTDEVAGYFGMRKISLGKDDKGFVRMMLNNKFVFQIGPLDQGFWPDGLYTAPTDAALKYDVEVTKKLGMNLARKHVKIEPARWYYWCDKLGLLVWQDMPSGNTTKDRPQFQTELAALVQGRGNHPCIVMWVIFNEGWGQAGKGRGPSPEGRKDTQFHVDLVRGLDPTRLICNASGWTDYAGVGDIMDIHRYPGPGAPKPEPKRAGVLGEFGGLGLPIPGHLWQSKNWGYRNMKDREQLTARYVDLLRKVYKFKDAQGLNAAVYTQTSDVEGEVNGLMTYDRAIIKPDVETVAAANQGEFPPEPIIKPVVPTSEAKGREWRFTTTEPADGWMKADFQDAAWKIGIGGFGEPTTPGAVVRTKWKTPDIWLRREFQLDTAAAGDLKLRIHHDEGVEVYVNGVLAARTKPDLYTSEYVQMPINKDAIAALKQGRNTLAVHCHQTSGGQYIDVGLCQVIQPPKKKR